ncbi:hypothetical protein JCM8547_003247 [Rhodosporidiobolus lusitaniae]
MANLPTSHSQSHIDTSYRYVIPSQPSQSTASPYGHLPPPSTYTSSLHSFNRVFPPATPLAASSAPASTPTSTLGTAENPLIPKRRRRTTPQELSVLEASFRQNPKPDPQERARIAERLGMTARAVAVWYQNKRQKEKKESGWVGSSSPASSIASGASEPKDLDGYTLSLSSSPLPSPNLPLYPMTGAVPLNPFKALPPSTELYSSATANKENTFPLHSARPAPQPLQSASSSSQTYHYSYPSSATAAQNTANAAAAASDSASTNSIPSVYLHRPHNTSIIAAKKHMRKRPLGSHAPLARTPSLPHSFEFPPSPPKASSSSHSRAPSARPAPIARVASLNDVFSRPSSAPPTWIDPHRRASSGASSSASLFAQAGGESIASRRRSSTPMSAVFSSVDEAMPDADAAGEQEEEDDLPLPSSSLATTAPPSSLPLPALTPASKARAKDDLLRHMESDPPSASSPAPLTRRRMAAHDATLSFTDDEEDDEEETVQVAEVPAWKPTLGRPKLASRSLSTASAPALIPSRPTHPSFSRSASVAALPSHPLTARSLSLPSRSSSLGPFTPSLSSSPAQPASLDKTIALASSSARAPGTGAESASVCAVKALGRKRARMSENGPPLAAFSRQVSSSKEGWKIPQQQQHKEEHSAAKRRRSSGPSVVTDVPSSASTTGEEDELADLSFSSTSTASTVDSLVTVADSPSASSGSYFALGAAVAVEAHKQQQGGKKAVVAAAAEEDERECAELLLGLGGFF